MYTWKRIPPPGYSRCAAPQVPAKMSIPIVAEVILPHFILFAKHLPRIGFLFALVPYVALLMNKHIEQPSIIVFFFINFNSGFSYVAVYTPPICNSFLG